MKKSKEETMAAPVLAGAVTVAVGPQEKVSIAAEIECKRLACEVLKGVLVVGERYMQLCRWIRHGLLDSGSCEFALGALDAGQVRNWLGDVGFHKSRVSEILKVATATDAVWAQYQGRLLGWKGTLDLARHGEVCLLAEGGSADNVPAVTGAVAELERAYSEVGGAAGDGGSEESKPQLTAFIKAARRLIEVFGKGTLARRVYRFGGYSVTVAATGRRAAAGSKE